MPRWIAMAVALLTLPACTAHVKVTYDEEPEQARIRLARELEKRLARALPPLLVSFAADRRALLDERTQTYPAEGVQALLTSTESSLQAPLEVPELAPIRDKVASVFSVARQDIGLTGEGHADHPPLPKVVLAAITSETASMADRLDRRTTDAAFNAVLKFLQRMLEIARRQESLVNLCVVSRPKTGAVFSMSAPSYPEQVYTRRTASQLLNIFRGIYAYTVQMGKETPIDCQPRPGKKLPPCTLDLWQFFWPTLDCDLVAANCLLNEGRRPSPPACEDHDR